MDVLYEDNHLIIVSKRAGEIVQGDKTGDTPLSETVKQYIKEKYHKEGQVFLGVVHRLDRPVSGVLCFARTSKGLSRMNRLFAENHQIGKTYLALTATPPPQSEGTLTHWLTRDTERNKAKAFEREVPGSKKAVLEYKLLGRTDRYYLLQVQLRTGRHHQIRCQLAKMGCPIRGDLKYGAPRSNPDGSISLHAHRLTFEHPVSHTLIDIKAPLPNENIWQSIQKLLDTE